MKSAIKFLATWGYLGLSPKAPGTIGSLGAIPFVYLLLHLPAITYMGITLGFMIAAVWVCVFYEQFFSQHDAKEVVIDEVVGMLIAMAWMPMTWQSFVMAFILFRVFDILKPFPIGWIDRKIEGGVGVVADDAVAGIFSNMILQWIYLNTSWLGVQLVG